MTNKHSVKASSDVILILPQGVTIAADPKNTLLDTLVDHDVAISHSCGGMGSCGTCRVFIEEGLTLLGPRGAVENEIAEEYGYDKNERLACQNNAHSGLVISLPRPRKSIRSQTD